MSSKSKPFKDPRGHSLRIYDEVLDSAAFTALSPHDVLAYLALLRDLKGSNNGDLSLPQSRAKRYGIGHHITLARSLRALCAVGLIAVTRKGGANKGGQRLVTLYRITDRECYEIRDKVEAMPATNEWRKVQSVEQGKKLIADFEATNSRASKLKSLRHPVTCTTTPRDVILASTTTSGDIKGETTRHAVTYGKTSANPTLAMVSGTFRTMNECNNHTSPTRPPLYLCHPMTKNIAAIHHQTCSKPSKGIAGLFVNLTKVTA